MFSKRGKGNRSRASADDLIVAALAAGKTQQEAAEIAGVAPRTVSRRVTDHAFLERVQAFRRQMIGRASGRIVEGMYDDVGKLRTLTKGKNKPVCLGACRTLLDFGFKSRAWDGLEERVAKLERELIEGDAK